MIKFCGSHRRAASLLAVGAFLTLPLVAAAQPLTAAFDTVTPDPREHMISQLRIVFSEPVFNLTIDEFTVSRPGGSIQLNGPTYTLTNPSLDQQTFFVNGLQNAYTNQGNYNVLLFADDVEGGGGKPLSNLPSEQFAVRIDPVPDAVEAAGPNGGDGNNDGTQDSEQSNVVTFPQDDDGDYVTVSARIGTWFTIMNHIPEADLPGTPPPGYTFPEGIIHFTLEGLIPGETLNVRQRFHNPENPIYDTWFKTDSDGIVWVPYGTVTYSPSPGAFTAFVQVTDGGPGDYDEAANGIIDDPSGPGFEPLAVELISLEAEEVAGGVNINWATASEIDSAGFTVYRASQDGNDKWVRGEQVSAGLIPAEGAVGVGASYTVFDATPLSGGEERNYMLVELELDGDQITYGPFGLAKTAGTTTAVENWSMFE